MELTINTMIEISTLAGAGSLEREREFLRCSRDRSFTICLTFSSMDTPAAQALKFSSGSTVISVALSCAYRTSLNQAGWCTGGVLGIEARS